MGKHDVREVIRMACWDERGCDADMQSYCPHCLGHDYCPADFKYAACKLPQHRVAVGFEILDNPDVDRSIPVKEQCRLCMFFINHGPKVGSGAVSARGEGMPELEGVWAPIRH